MEKRITNKIKELQNSSASQEEFMKKLAEVDENGHLTDEAMSKLNGGTDIREVLGYFIEKVKELVG